MNLTFLQQVVFIIYALAVAGRWEDIREFIALIKALISKPTVTLVPGAISDKPSPT